MEKIKVMIKRASSNIAGEAMVLDTANTTAPYAIVVLRKDANASETVYGIYDLTRAGHIGNIRFLNCDIKIAEIAVVDSRPIEDIFTEDELSKMIRYYR